jgi:hypothetical protein
MSQKKYLFLFFDERGIPPYWMNTEIKSQTG